MNRYGLFMPFVFFGPAWDTPAVEGALQVGTPVGRPCSSCQELIVPGDRGYIEITNVVNNDPESGTVTHIHAECQLDENVGHIIGICVCRAIPAGRRRAREIWTHFYDEQGRSMWPQNATR